MSTTDTPSWAAAAATVNPPAPAPITHRSARMSPPAAEVRMLLAGAASRSVLPLPAAPIRIKPTARSLGSCMSGPPFPHGDGNERHEPQEGKGEHQVLGDERAYLDAELAGLGPLLRHACRIFGLRGDDDAVETRTCRRERESGGNDTEKCGDNVSPEWHAEDCGGDIDEPERESRHQAQEQKIAQRILLEALAQLGEPRPGAHAEPVAQGAACDQEKEGGANGGANDRRHSAQPAA